MKTYFIRALKFALYFLSILLIILLFIYAMSKDVWSSTAHFSNIFADGKFLWMLLMAAAFGLIYPLAGFAGIKIPLNKNIGDDKSKLIELFDTRKYKLVNDDGKVLYFRPKSKINRITRMSEDTLEVNYEGSTLKIKGLRKDVYRFKLPLEEFAQLKKV